MYARGMTVREIRGHLEELYGIEVSPDLISAITDAVLDELQNGRTGPSILALNAVGVQMLLELGIQDPLRKRLLQLVNQPVFIEYVLQIAAGQKLVQ